MCPLAVLVTQGQVEGHVDGADQTRGLQQAALQGVGFGAGILERQVELSPITHHSLGTGVWCHKRRDKNMQSFFFLFKSSFYTISDKLYI